LSKRLLVIPCLLLALSLALAACGGGGGSDDEGKIEEAIETSATSSDPSNCTEIETLNFVEQSTDVSGKGAVKACEEEQEGEEGEEGKAESVAVSNVEVDGSKATAQAAITGGSLDSQAVNLSLVEEDGSWKLDEITGFAKLDIGALAKVFGEQLEKSGELEPQQTSCIVEGLEEASEAEVEELVLEGSSSSFEEVAEGCA
jgi:hypothetical protein